VVPLGHLQLAGHERVDRRVQSSHQFTPPYLLETFEARIASRERGYGQNMPDGTMRDRPWRTLCADFAFDTSFERHGAALRC
jgi:hypothetical protein